MDNKHTGTQDPRPRGAGPVKGRRTKATKAALLAAVVVGSWWQPRDSASRRGPKLLVPREIVEMADAGYGMRARLSPGYDGGKSTWITVRLLLNQYRLCERPRPVEPKAALHEGLNGAGSALRAIIRDEVTSIMRESLSPLLSVTETSIRGMVRAECLAAIREAFEGGAR